MSRPPLSPLVIAIIAVLLIGGSLFVYFKFMPQGGDDGPGGFETTPPPPTLPPPTAEDEAPPPSIELPNLEESDETVRSLLGQLSQHPSLTGWLAADELVHRFVKVVNNAARRESPRVHVPFMAPKDEFQVTEDEIRSVISDDSFRRYDLLTAAFVSLDETGTAQFLRILSPLFEEAWGQLGNPETFDEILAMAIDNVVTVQVPDEIEVEKQVTSYRFADPELEALDPLSKHLLRLGPDNARQIQDKLRRLRDALQLPKATSD